MNTQLKRKLQNPFLRLKWLINERAKVKDCYYSVRSIKEILAKKEQVYLDLLREERQIKKDEGRIQQCEGFLQALSWLFSAE